MIGVLSPGNSYFGQQLAHFHLHQLQQLLVIDHVGLVQVHDDVGHPHLARQQDVLARLRHRPVGRRHHQNRPVHLRRPGDHVLHVVGVPRTVHVRVVPLRRLVFHVRRVDRDPARLLLRRRCRSGRRPSPPRQTSSTAPCVSAAVSVVLPWSTCPIVPTFTCGFVRSNFPFAMTDSSCQCP